MQGPDISPVTGQHTKIRVCGKTWQVPVGFGVLYRRLSQDHLRLMTIGESMILFRGVVGLLGLIGYRVSLEQVAGWDLRKRVEAVAYASNVHARASDNPVRRHPTPHWLAVPAWQGPPEGEGAFAGPSGTLIVEGP